MAVGEFVGSGVLDGVKVIEGVKVTVDVLCLIGVQFGLVTNGVFVEVLARVMVAVLVKNTWIGVFDGVGDSPANPVGKAEPIIGMDIRNVRALADTMETGPMGMIGRMGS